MKSMPTTSVGVDANLAVRAVIPFGHGKELEQLTQWKRTNTQIFTPDLWCAEVTSAIRVMSSRKLVTIDESQAAIFDLFALGIQLVPSDADLCISAFQWAVRLGQIRAYDGFYLALAEKIGVELWTADERLVNRSHQVDAHWVRWIGEA